MPKKKQSKQRKINKNGILFFILLALFILALIFDNQLFIIIQQFRISLNIPFNLNFIESYWFYIIAFVLSILFIILDNKVKNKKKNIFRYIIGVAIAMIITTILKFIVSRPRPIPSQSSLSGDEKSFPSGHTTFMFSTLSFLKNWLSIIWLIPSIAIALERLWQGAHFPSDIIAAVIIGYFVPILTTKLINKIRLNPSKQSSRARRATKKIKKTRTRSKK